MSLYEMPATAGQIVTLDLIEVNDTLAVRFNTDLQPVGTLYHNRPPSPMEMKFKLESGPNRLQLVASNYSAASRFTATVALNGKMLEQPLATTGPKNVSYRTPIIYSHNGIFVDDTFTFKCGAGDFPIRAGFAFKQTPSLTSAENALYNSDKSCMLVFQSDGNLVVYKGTVIDPKNATWAFNKQPKNALAWPDPINRIKNVTFGPDGNLVASDSAGAVVWQTSTDGHPKAQLQVTADGKLSITDGGQTIWPN